MKLHLIYRSYGGENMKSRPGIYSKTLTLTSFVRAAAAVPEAEVLFINDGPIPTGRLAIMERFGTVQSLGDTAQGMRYSYRHALEMACASDWADDDVVCFIEDDYLFSEDALLAQVDAAERLPEASYFTLYGDRPDPHDPDDRREHGMPRGWQPAPARTIDGRTWFNRTSITSTFAARLGALRSDLDIFVLCMRPFRQRYLDHETALLYQAVVPYHGREFFFGLQGDFVPGLRGVVRATVLIPYRVVLNRRARQQRKAHLLYAVSPNVATHLEHPFISPDRDWDAEAADIVAWAVENNLPSVPVLNNRSQST